MQTKLVYDADMCTLDSVPRNDDSMNVTQTFKVIKQKLSSFSYDNH